MKMKREELRGTRQVFRFSLQQYFKSKATYVMLAVMFFGTGLSVLFSGLGMQRGEEIGTNADRVVILDRSPYSADYAAVLPEYVETELRSEPLESLLDEMDAGADGTVTVEIAWDPGLAFWEATAFTGKDSRVSQTEAENLAAYCASALEEARYRALDVSEEQITLALAPAGLSVLGEAELSEDAETDKTDDMQSNYLVGFACSVLVFMLISVSANYIVKAIAEEKSSRLVEVLMISIRPLALVAGKILAALCLVLAGAALAALGLFASRFGLVLLGHGGGTAAAGLGEALKSLSAGGILVLLVSLILGYLSYALMAGISGACCSTAADSDAASTTVMLTAMTGYIIGTVTSMVGKNAVITVISVLPFLSPFIAPGRYMNGQMDFWALPVSWVLQIAALALLARSCAGVYDTLIFHRGERVKLKQVLKMMKGGADR